VSDLEHSDSFQAAMDQIDALSKAATAAATVTATVETELVTLTLSASLQIESISYPFAAFRGVGADRLAEATVAAVAEAVVQVRAAQVESLQSMPALAAVLDPSGVSTVDLPPQVVEEARVAATELQTTEFTAADADGRVEVTVSGAGEVTRLWLSATAARESAVDWLAPTVQETVNDALAQARGAQESLLSGGGSGDLEAQLDEVVGAYESRIDGLSSRLDEVTRRLGLR
jgi:DNA-binding protein YbaB